MQALHHVVVGFRRGLAGIGTNVNEYRLGLRHLVSPVLASENNGGQPRASRTTDSCRRLDRAVVAFARRAKALAGTTRRSVAPLTPTLKWGGLLGVTR